MPEADAAGTPPQQDDDPPPTQGEQSLERDAADDAGSVAVVHLEPQALWQQLDEAVAQGAPAIPTIHSLLRELCFELDGELGALPPDETYGGSSSGGTGACPHVKACLEHLHVLESVLLIEPPPVAVQYDSQHLQPAVGSHRVLASEAVAHLVMAQSPLVDTLVAAAQLVPRVVHLALRHPLCSVLHVRVAALIRAGVTSPADDLLGPLVRVPGWGLGLARVGTRWGAAEAPRDEAPAGLCPPLPSLLIDIASSALGTVGGRRDPRTGFCLDVCRALRDAVHDAAAAPEPDAGPGGDGAAAAPHPQGGRKCNDLLELALMTDAAWSDFTAAGGEEAGADGCGGALARLCAEQEGDLGGPRPAPAPLSDDGQDLVTELAGGRLITGPEILAFLQGWSLGPV